MAEQNYTINDMFSMSHNDLITYLSKLCKIDIPVQIETTEELKKASILLGRLGSLYSFLTNTSMRINIQKRMYKKDKENKDKYEDALIRESIFNTFIDQIKFMYNAISRMVSIRQQISQETKMLGEQI